MSEFDKQVKSNLKSLQSEVIKIVKKMGDMSLDYNIQVAIDCMHPNQVHYGVWIQPPANRINRLSWLTTDFDELLKQLKDFADNKYTSAIGIEMTYHQAQIDACKETIAHHEQELEKLTKEFNEEKDGVNE